MSDQFDKKLVNKINEIFDNFEDDSVNDSWTELRKRLPEKESKPKLIWWFSSAAAILLLCGTWFFSNQYIKDNSELAKTADELTLKKTHSTESILTTGNSPKNFSSQTPEIKAKELSIKTKSRRDNLAFKHRKVIFPASRQTITAQSETHTRENSEYDLTLMALIPDQTKKTEAPAELPLASDTLQPSIVIANSDNSINTKEIYPSEVISRDELSKLIQTDKAKNKLKTDKKLSIGVFAGTYFNYAEGSETSINTGLGLTSDIKISKRIKISTGVSLGQNTLKYNQLIPKDAALSFAALHNSTIALDTKQGFNSASTLSYSINSYDAKLLGFDFPVNIKYTLFEKKSTVYMSTGFSSNLFIKESYTYNFDYQMNSNNSTTLPTQQSTSSFQSFDFARVLNFSLGLDHRLNNQTKLIFEPFIKYPLSGLGAYDLRFGAAGMNLKLNFNRLK